MKSEAIPLIVDYDPAWIHPWRCRSPLAPGSMSYANTPQLAVQNFLQIMTSSAWSQAYPGVQFPVEAFQ